jgi:hypothetical protein
MSDEPLCRSCGSCGFPLRDAEATYCGTCADADGTLKPYDAVVAANASYFVEEQGVAPQAALAMARALLANKPAWKDRS